MSTARYIFEGTWEEISREAERLAGKRLRVEVLGNTQEVGEPALPLPATASPEARAQAILDWGYGHPPRNAPPLSDDAISRDSIYSAEYE